MADSSTNKSIPGWCSAGVVKLLPNSIARDGLFISTQVSHALLGSLSGTTRQWCVGPEEKWTEHSMWILPLPSKLYPLYPPSRQEKKHSQIRVHIPARPKHWRVVYKAGLGRGVSLEECPKGQPRRPGKVPLLPHRPEIPNICYRLLSTRPLV